MNLPEQIKQMEDIEKENDAKLKDETVFWPAPDQILSRLIENRKAEQELADVHTSNVRELSKKIKALEKEKERQAKRVKNILG